MRLLLILAALIITGCTYSRIGVNHDTGQRSVFIVGMPCKISDGVVETDNRIISIALDSIDVEK